MRQRTSDVPTHLLPTPEHGTLRSYATRGATFILSRLRATKHSAAGAWRLTHQPSGAVSMVRSYADGIALIRRLQSAPSADEGAAQRFVILPHDGGGDGSGGGGVVLFDRVTGKWFPRSIEQPIQQHELEGMARLQPPNSISGMTDWQMELGLSTTTSTLRGVAPLPSTTPTPTSEQSAQRAVAEQPRRARRRSS